MRIRLKALIPLLGVVGAWLASPEALALVPDKWSHVLIAVSSFVAVLTPALLTNRPKTPRRPKKSALARAVEAELHGDGSGDELAPMDPGRDDADPVPPLGKIPAKEKGDA
jgi:hypothetical protein